jgi:signal transduction histidine kinase
MYITFFFVASGISSFMAAVNTLQYFVNKDKAYLWYALYLGISAATLIHFQYIIAGGTHISAIHTVWSLTILQRLIIISYLAFSIAFFQNDAKNEHVLKIWKQILLIILFLFFIELIIYCFDGNQNLLLTVQRYFTFLRTALLLVCILYLRLIESPLRVFYLIGTLLLWIGVLISLLLPKNLMQTDVLYLNSYFYRTIAVLLEVVCFTVGLSYRSMLLLKQQQAQTDEERSEKEQIRNHIAADLHDELGTGLSTIRLLGERAQLDRHNVENVDKMTVQARELIEKMSTIIWAMNSEKDTVESLVHYVRAYSFEYLQDIHKLSIQFPLPDLPPSVFSQSLTGDTRREVFLTIKEALHNIVKHAEAAKVFVSIGLKDNYLEMCIRDNGKGFKGKNHMGNGLKNMANRMKKIGGSFQISTNETAPVEVILQLPLTKVRST